MIAPGETMLTSMAMVDSIYKKYISSDYDWWELPQVFFAKTGTGSHFTNDLSDLFSAYRNIYMVQRISQEVNAGKRVFDVVGRNNIPYRPRI